MQTKLYIGIDVGGTKISAGLVSPQGKIIAWQKLPNPPQSSSRQILGTMNTLIQNLLSEKNIPLRSLQGIGVGVPGIVNPQTGDIVRTPNIRLSHFPLKRELQKRWKTKVIIDNDVNLGILGEKWLGAARKAKHIIGIFPGTGVGGGIILNGEIYSGAHGAAAEIGHILIDPKGPPCTCGNNGCLEALISRWAIERDIRGAIKKGEKSLITSLTNNELKVIKSKIIRQALLKKDPLVKRVMKQASEFLGRGCISLRHTFDPELIVLGGGLIEACGDFILPIVKRVFSADPFFAELPACPIVPSQLGDEAVIIGAIHLVSSR